MGGCRCSFRSCTVTTLNFPGMHFFHYPLKHEERLHNWIKYANYPRFLELAPVRAKNMVVCALHFRDECFMNYKKDRLTPQAVPTLQRLRNGLVLDYSLSANPKPMAIAPSTEKHLIPPKGFIALGLREGYFTDITAHVEMLDDEEDEAAEPLAKRLKTTKVAQAPKILNKGVRSSPVSSINGHHLNNDDPYEVDFGVVPNNGKCELSRETLTTTAVVSADDMINLSEIEFLPAEKEVSMDDGNFISKEVYDQTVDAFESELTELKRECEKKVREAEGKATRLQAELAEAWEKVRLALDSAKTAKSSAIGLQEKLEASEAVNQELAAKAAEPPKQQKSTGLSFGQLTKPQLFNGIKKYLSASMTALVRMEMFGGTERQWKPDEKQVSVELLRLGEKVYDYFSDEWRFRLPPKKQVKKWTNEVTNEDEDDL